MKLISTLTLIVSTTISLSACYTTPEKPIVDDQLLPDIEVVVPDIVVAFEKGDTLWDFAERTTGSGFNWEQLKEVNQIQDETKIDAGIDLLVPYDLALESLKSQ